MLNQLNNEIWFMDIGLSANLEFCSNSSAINIVNPSRLKCNIVSLSRRSIQIKYRFFISANGIAKPEIHLNSSRIL